MGVGLGRDTKCQDVKVIGSKMHVFEEKSRTITPNKLNIHNFVRVICGMGHNLLLRSED